MTSIEDAIEARVGEEWQRPTGAAVGRVLDDGQGFETYVSHLVRSAPNRFDGIKVVIDCANGAASLTAPEALRRLGAEVITYGAPPGRPEHQPRVRLHPHGGPAPRGDRARRRPRHRARRRRRPLPGVDDDR